MSTHYQAALCRFQLNAVDRTLSLLKQRGQKADHEHDSFTNIGAILLSKPTFLSKDDLELLDHEFVVQNPLEIPNLVDRLPQDYDHPTIVAKYDLTTQRPPRLRCAHCGLARHWKGYILALPNGDHALLAERHCGREQFGLKWGSIENIFLRRETRQINLRRLIEVRRVFSDFKDEVLCLQVKSEVSAFDDYMHDLGHKLGKLAKSLGGGPRRDGRLDAITYRRDPDAEERQARKREPNLFDDIDNPISDEDLRRAYRHLHNWIEENGKIYKAVSVPVGICAGFRILSLEKPSRLLVEANDQLRQLELIFLAQTLEGISDEQLSSTLKAIRGIIEKVEIALSLLDELAKFTEPRNLTVIANWATKHEDIEGSYEAKQRALIAPNGSRLEAPVFSPIETPILDAMLKTVGRI